MPDKHVHDWESHFEDAYGKLAAPPFKVAGLHWVTRCIGCGRYWRRRS